MEHIIRPWLFYSLIALLILAGWYTAIPLDQLQFSSAEFAPPASSPDDGVEILSTCEPDDSPEGWLTMTCNIQSTNSVLSGNMIWDLTADEEEGQ